INTINTNINTVDTNINTVDTNINTVDTNINTVDTNINTQNNNNNIINFYTLDFNKIDSYFTDNKISIGAIIISKDSKLLICEKYNSFVFFKIAWLITEKILYDKPNISNINIYINALLLSEKYIINKIKNKYNDLLNIFHSIIKNNTYIKN